MAVDRPANPGGGLPNELPRAPSAQLRSARGRSSRRAFFGYGTASVPARTSAATFRSDDSGRRRRSSRSARRAAPAPEFRASAVVDQAGRITYVAVPTSDMKETLDQLLLIEAIVTAAVLIALAGLAWWMIGIGLRPLERMR